MLNKITLIGNLGKDVRASATSSGTCVAKFSIATQSWNGKENETTWFNVVVFGKRAEATAKMLQKGSQVYVEGRVQIRSFENKDGEKITIVEVIASDVKFLSRLRPMNNDLTEDNIPL